MHREVPQKRFVLGLILLVCLVTSCQATGWEFRRVSTPTPTNTPIPTSTRPPTPVPTPTLSPVDIINASTTSIMTFAEVWIQQLGGIGLGEGNKCRLGERAAIAFNLANDSPQDYVCVTARFESDYEKNFFQGLLYDRSNPPANERSDYREEWLTLRGLYRRVSFREFTFPGLKSGKADSLFINLIPATVGEWDANVSLFVVLADGRTVELRSWAVRFLVLPTTK